MTRAEACHILTTYGISNRFSLRTIGGIRETWQHLEIKDWQPEDQELPDDLQAQLRKERVTVGLDPVEGYGYATSSGPEHPFTRHYFTKREV